MGIGNEMRKVLGRPGAVDRAGRDHVGKTEAMIFKFNLASQKAAYLLRTLSTKQKLW